MLDIKFINANTQYVKDALAKRNKNYDIDAVLSLDARRRELLVVIESSRNSANKMSAEISELARKKTQDARADIEAIKEKVKQIKDSIRESEAELGDVEVELKSALLCIPNLPDESVPVGADESANVVVRQVLSPKKFDFEPLSHWDIGERLNILDPVSAAKVTGARFHVYRGLGARLERAIYCFMLDTHVKNGYTEILPPFMVNRESMTGTGQLPKFEEDAFAVRNTDYFLVPTAEVPITNLHRGEILNAEQLPIRYCAYTPCFRAEAGSAGRDTRGLIRQHQFNKVELVKFCLPENSFDELEGLTNDAERILQLLEIPYRVVALSTGDLGFSSAKTYDIEVWMPSYNRYVEISSCSNFVDYQARRMAIRFRRGNKNELLHTLNGSGLAVGRTNAAILENFQNADGSVCVPKVLVPYMGGVEKISV